MNAMVPTQAWDENGPPLNPPQVLNNGEDPIGTGQESVAKEVCVTLSELLSPSTECVFSYLDMYTATPPGGKVYVDGARCLGHSWLSCKIPE